MYCYFLCDVPCAVKLDGEFVGVASKNLSFVEKERCFLEFIPLDDCFEKTYLLFDKKHPVSTKNVKIIDLYGGFLIIPSFSRKVDADFKMIGRKTFPFSQAVSVICYSQGGIKLCVCKENDFFIEPIPFLPSDIRFETCVSNGNEYLAVICISNKTEILVFNVKSKINLAFKNLCDGYSLVGNTITTLEHRPSVLGHSLSSTWLFEDKVTLKNYTISRSKQVFSLPEKLLPIAFFEELLIDGNVEEFLSPELKPRANELKEFLGDFKRVLPPPHFKDDDLVTLLYADKVEYARIDTNGGLISNLTII